MEQAEFKPCGRMKIMKARIDISQIENRKTIERINKTKTWFFENIIKIDKHSARLTKKTATLKHYAKCFAHLKRVCKGRQKRSLQAEIGNITGRVSWFCSSSPEGKSQSEPNWEVNTPIQNLQPY